MKKGIKTIISVLAYIWAIICIFIVFVIFLGSDPLSAIVARLPFMKVDPAMSGGEVAYTYLSSGLNIQINNPVFSALIGESKRGFVQVEFHPDTLSAASLSVSEIPGTISETIDYDQDQVSDFTLNIDTVTGQTDLLVCPSKNMTVSVSAKVKDYWVVRIALPNPRFAESCTTCSTCPLNLTGASQ